MAVIRDLEPCFYFPIECDVLYAVGWLGAEAEYTRGRVPGDFFEKLKVLCLNPWQPVVALGGHACELCQFEAPRFSSNVFIPFAGRVYVAPVAVVHYIAVHWYTPPEVFIQAVLACPPMRSMEYYKALLVNGGRSLVGRSRV